MALVVQNCKYYHFISRMPVRHHLLVVLVNYLFSGIKNQLTKCFVCFAFFNRKPGLTGRGLYELKPECAKNFNLYFYHFSRAEQSKVTSSLTSLTTSSW